jgi:hypothetical protein
LPSQEKKEKNTKTTKIPNTRTISAKSSLMGQPSMKRTMKNVNTNRQRRITLGSSNQAFDESIGQAA